MHSAYIICAEVAIVNMVQIESSINDVTIEPSNNNISIETILIWTDYSFIAPAQILPEHKEAET